MFRIIGAVMVYGFATYGVVTLLQKFRKDKGDRKDPSS